MTEARIYDAKKSFLVFIHNSARSRTVEAFVLKIGLDISAQSTDTIDSVIRQRDQFDSFMQSYACDRQPTVSRIIRAQRTAFLIRFYNPTNCCINFISRLGFYRADCLYSVNYPASRSGYQTKVFWKVRRKSSGV